MTVLAAVGTTAPVRRPGRRAAPAVVAAVAVLLVAVALSLAVGSELLGPRAVLRGLFGSGGSGGSVEVAIVRGTRLPRTVLGLVCGAALGVTGALLQALTRNPLADPGLLGVNAGAATAVVLTISLAGATSPLGYVGSALAGAAAAAVVVTLLGSRGPATATPVRLALAGTAVTAALGAVTTGVALSEPGVFGSFRFWAVGALAGRGTDVVAVTAAPAMAGVVLGLLLARPLDALALGERTGVSLGARPGRTRALGLVAVTLCAGAATAATGPIGFVGLTVPHAARALVGPSQHRVLPLCALLAPSLLLLTDVVGRVVARPGEIEVGVVTAVVGAPFFVALVCRRRLARL